MHVTIQDQTQNPLACYEDPCLSLFWLPTDTNEYQINQNNSETQKLAQNTIGPETEKRRPKKDINVDFEAFVLELEKAK